MANLTQITTAQERAVLRAFREAVQSVKDQAVIQEIVRLLEAGNVDGVIDLLQLDQATFEPLENAIRQAYRQGGLTGAEQIGTIPTEAGTLVMRFNMAAPAAETWLANLSSRLITEVFDEQKQMVRERLTAGLARGDNPRQTALDLVGRIDPTTRERTGGFIGLTSRQAQWVASAREELESLNPNYLTRELRDKRLDGAVRKAIEEGKPLTERQINTAISRMQARTLRYRGEVIARTESINSLRAGQFEAIQQAVERGEVEARDVRKAWDSSSDARTRLDHLQMEQTYREGIPLDDPFIAPDFSRLMYPGDNTLGASGAQTIQCFVPETPIAVYGLKSAIRREYSGQVVKLSAGSGVNLTVTPNHPVLTSRGWLPAGEIVKGDKLIDCGIARKLSGIEPDVADGITTAEQLYNSAQALGRSERVSPVVVNLHGEIPAQDVDVVTVDSSLRDAFDSPSAQFCGQFSLAETDVSLVGAVFDRIVNSCGLTTPDNSGSEVGGRGSLPTFVRAGKGGASRVALGYRRPIYAHVVKAPIDFVSGYSKLFGYAVNGLSRIKESLNVRKMLGSAFLTSSHGSLRFDSRYFFRSYWVKPEIRKATIDDMSASPENLGDRIDRLNLMKPLNVFVKAFSRLLPVVNRWPAFVDSHIDDSLSDNSVSQIHGTGDIPDTLARFVHGFDVVKVDSAKLYHYEGPVYNFETDNGLVVSGNTISHNCRCKAIYRIDFIGRQARIEGFE